MRSLAEQRPPPATSKKPESVRQMLAWPSAIIFMVAAGLLALLVVTRPERIVEIEVERRVEIPIEIPVDKPVGDLSLLPERDRRLHALGRRIAVAEWTSSAEAILRGGELASAAARGGTADGSRTPTAAGSGQPPLSFAVDTAIDSDFDARIGAGSAAAALRDALRRTGIRTDPNAPIRLEVVLGLLGGGPDSLVLVGSIDVVDEVLVERDGRHAWTAASLHSDWVIRSHDASEDSEPHLEAVVETLVAPLGDPTRLGFAPAAAPPPSESTAP